MTVLYLLFAVFKLLLPWASCVVIAGFVCQVSDPVSGVWFFFYKVSLGTAKMLSKANIKK